MRKRRREMPPLRQHGYHAVRRLDFTSCENPPVQIAADKQKKTIRIHQPVSTAQHVMHPDDAMLHAAFDDGGIPRLAA
ncbi:hypothetical protein BM221_001168 [Beauveria bassiana]|uniref:Uncharacterized protein n=1 Tax=Beauveria bassiana TaxID=176275 RepID=A0A2N6P2J8_BEABA|nr:hypothetical protein BM221_001168 [Beauveria bassiana]